MIQTGITVKNVIGFIKNYLSVLVVAPAFLGGLWQVIELSNISITYIRFFSISQIVPDGLLILLFLLLGLSYPMLGWFANTLFFIKENREPLVLTEEEFEKKRKLQIKVWFILFVFFYSLAMYNYFSKTLIKSALDDLKWEVGKTFLFLVIINGCLNKCFSLARQKHKEFFKFCNVFLIILYFIISFYFCKRIHNDFMSTTDFDNIDNVRIKVMKKYPNTKQELLYFNDKYIFFSIENISRNDVNNKSAVSKTNKIYIAELKSLFENSSD